MKKNIVIASTNQGKIYELRKILNWDNTEFISQEAFNIPECPEPYLTFIENALAKARHTSKYTGLAAIADDSGICIPALNNLPAVHSARWAEFNNYGEHIKNKDKRNNAYLCHKIKEFYAQFGVQKIIAYYYCSIVMVNNENDPMPLIATGKIYGELQLEAKGDGGFGYDPHFYLPPFNKTVAELSKDEKNAISHRRAAISRLII